MQHGPDEHFETTLEDAARRTDARLVLVEPLGGLVARCADVDTMGAARTVAVVEQHQVQVRSSAALALEPGSDVVCEGSQST